MNFQHSVAEGPEVCAHVSPSASMVMLLLTESKVRWDVLLAKLYVPRTSINSEPPTVVNVVTLKGTVPAGETAMFENVVAAVPGGKIDGLQKKGPQGREVSRKSSPPPAMFARKCTSPSDVPNSFVRTNVTGAGVWDKPWVTQAWMV